MIALLWPMQFPVPVCKCGREIREDEPTRIVTDGDRWLTLRHEGCE